MLPPSVRPPAIQWPLNAIRLAIVAASLLTLAFGWIDLLRNARHVEAVAVEQARLQARVQARTVGELVQATLDGIDVTLKAVRAVAHDGPGTIDRQVRLALQGMSPDFMIPWWTARNAGGGSASTISTPRYARSAAASSPMCASST